jgi:ABC-type amino acid transport substrate-binding protein
VTLFVSTGPAPGLETPAPTDTPAPTETPGPVESFPASGDRLARILDAGVIRVNIAQDDTPWSFAAANGRRNGFDAAVARSLAAGLGVTLELTTFPLDEVRAGLWDDRFDVAISRLAVTQADPQLLEFSDPYAFDPQQLSVTAESGLTSVDELADRAICTNTGDAGAAWLTGSLSLVGAPLEPAAPPSGATAFDGPTNTDCIALMAAGGAPFDGWLASLPTIDRAVGAEVPVATVGDPVVWAPVAVAFDAKAGDNASLIDAVNGVLATLADDGTLAKASIRATGYDLTSVPADGVPVPAT